MRSTARRAAMMSAAMIGFCIAAQTASAEVVPGQPDESIAQAYPISQGTSYAGAFDDARYDDVDYLAFRVTQPGQTLEFRIANTTAPCVDPNDAGCPVYATLMDSSDQQVGGAGSAAGTIATNGDTEVFDWTFSDPGTYYLLMESNGDEAPGNPSYTVQFRPPPATGGGSGGSSGNGASARIVRSFTVAPRQRGTSVLARVVLGQPASHLLATLLAPGQRPRFVARLQQAGLPAGPRRLTLRLGANYRTRLKRKHHLSLLLKLTAVAASGQQVTLSRPVTLSG